MAIRQFIYGKPTTVRKAFGVPLVARVRVSNGSNIRNLYLRILLPFSMPKENSANHCHETTNIVSEEMKEMEDATNSGSHECTKDVYPQEAEAQFDCDFKFYLQMSKEMPEALK